MTNSEAIKLIKGILPRKVSYANLIGASSCYGDKYVYESPEPYALELAISALEENDKLKAEIEQLKSELEQIEKSFPMLCETCNYEYDLHPCDVCELKDKWKLKGKV